MIVEVAGQSTHAATGGVDPSADQDAQSVLLLHGAGMDGTVWQLQTRYLAYRGFRPMAVDLPGHGRSDGQPLESISEMADWVEQFLEAADRKPSSVIGHSMGSFVGLELARRHPDAVTNLILMGTANAMPVHPELLSAAEGEVPKAAALMASWSHAKPAHIGLNPTPGLWMLGGARALVENSSKGVLAADFKACAAYEDALTAAAAVSCPTTVIVGLRDKMTPPKATHKLIAEIPEPSVFELPQVGHMMMVEDPSAVRKALLAGLKTG